MVKRSIPYLLIIVLSFLSCGKVLKDPNGYYPQVKTTAVVLNADGSVTVSGKVTSSGNSAIVYCGACMDTLPKPDMITNQMLATTLTNDTFSCTYTGLNALSTYYCRAFVTNANGYAMGDAVSISHTGFDTSQIPCHPRAQYMALTGASNSTEPYYLVTSVTHSGPGYEVTGNTDSHALDITFDKYPVTGIYTNASVTFDAIAVSGCTLYVQQISSGVIDITICIANVQVQNMFSGNYSTYTMTTKFRSPS